MIAALCAPASAAAQCSLLGDGGVQLGDAIGLVADAGVPPRVIDEAIAIWKSCPSFGSAFPAFTAAAGASRTLVVRYQKIRKSPGDRKSCGAFSGNTIVLYGYVVSPRRRIYHCGSLASNLAHELGHALGLADAPPGPACARHVMADLTSDHLFNRGMDDEACRVVGRRWITPDEAARSAGPRIGSAAFPYPSLASALCD